jgi:Mn-containing catalase
MTDDAGVKDLLAFLLARDTMHQNQWIAAARELQEEGLEGLPVPSKFPLENEQRDVAYTYLNFSDGQAASEGSWASGPTPDGLGEFSYAEGPGSSVPMPPPPQPDKDLYGTLPVDGRQTQVKD